MSGSRNQDLNTVKEGWEAKKDGWKKDFIQKVNECFTDHDALTRAFNQRESLDKRFQKNEASSFVQLPSNTFSNAELELAFHSVNNPKNQGTVELADTIATYLIHDSGRARGYLRQAGLSEAEIDSISKIDQLKYDAVIFSCLSDFNVQMLEDLTKTSLFSNDEEGGLVEGFTIVNEFSRELATVAADIVRAKCNQKDQIDIISEEELKKIVAEEIVAKNRFDEALKELDTLIKDNLKSEQDIGERVFYQRIAEQLKFDLENKNKNANDYNKEMIDAFTESVKKTIEALKEPKEKRASRNIDNNAVKGQLDLIEIFRTALNMLKVSINTAPDFLEKKNFEHIIRSLESSFNDQLLHLPDSKAFDSEMVQAYINALDKTESSYGKLKWELSKQVVINPNQQNVISLTSVRFLQKQKSKTFLQCLFSALGDAITYKAAFSSSLVCAGLTYFIFPPLTIFVFMAVFSTVTVGVALGNATYDYLHQNSEKKPDHLITSENKQKKDSSTGGLFRKFKIALYPSLKQPKQITDAAPINALAQAPTPSAVPATAKEPAPEVKRLGTYSR